MANKITNTQYYSDIAGAIREKTGGSATYTPPQMAAAIRSIQGAVDLENYDYFLNDARYRNATFRNMATKPKSAKALFNGIKINSTAELEALFAIGSSIDLSECDEAGYFYHNIELANGLSIPDGTILRPFNKDNWKIRATAAPCGVSTIETKNYLARWIACPLNFVGEGECVATIMLPTLKNMRIEPATDAEKEAFKNYISPPDLYITLTLFGENGNYKVGGTPYIYSAKSVLFENDTKFFPDNLEEQLGMSFSKLFFYLDISDWTRNNTVQGLLPKENIDNILTSVANSFAGFDTSKHEFEFLICTGFYGLSTSAGWDSDSYSNSQTNYEHDGVSATIFSRRAKYNNTISAGYSGIYISSKATFYCESSGLNKKLIVPTPTWKKPGFVDGFIGSANSSTAPNGTYYGGALYNMLNRYGII